MSIPIITAALEKGVYNIFHQNFVSWRQASISGKLIKLDQLQLPNNSVLHVVDQFLHTPVTTVLPDLNNPLIHNETFQKWLETIDHIPGSDALFPITDRYRFRPSRYFNDIRAFWIDHRKTIKRPSSRDAMLHQTQALPIINYNEILTAQIIGGQFIYYRQFDLLFRTILNTISSITGKHQWLQIPLSRTLYRKVQFMQTFEQINYQTVRIKTDPSFYFLIQLINFVVKGSATSLLSQLPDTTLDTFNVILTAGDTAIIYNLGDLKAILETRPDNNFYQLVLRHVNTLKLAGFAQHDISDLDDVAYTKLVDEVAPSDNHEPEDAPPSHDEIPSAKPLSVTPNINLPPSTISHIVPEPHSDPKTSVPPQVKHVAELPKSNTTNSQADNGKTPISAPIVSKPSETAPTEVTTRTSSPQTPLTLIETIDQGAHNTIMAAEHLTEDQKAAALIASQVYKTLLVDGVTIETHLQQSAEPAIAASHLDFLQDKVVDKSMLNSTAIDLDKHYLDHVMTKDLSSVLAHMSTIGMFLIKVDQRDEVTQLNRIRHYKTVYQDIMGRRHTVSFKLPIVSSDGTIMINGIESRMIKQQVNLPICKIDANRVSLASSYNKTLVERIGTKAHNFNAYICRYIDTIVKAKVGLELGYGGLDITTTKLPYDYSSIARRYSTLHFQGPAVSNGERAHYRFTFDYTKRFVIPKLEHAKKVDQAKVAAHTLRLQELETTYGVYCGTARCYGHQYRMFFGYDNQLRFVGPNRGMTPIADQYTTPFLSLLVSAFAAVVTPPKMFSEWTELKILDKTFPIVFILGFEYGLQRVLDHLSLTYQFIPNGTRVKQTSTTIVIPFADGNLVFDRYPLTKSFVVAGLLKFTTKPYEFAQFNTQDIYYTLLRESGISLNYLKGISDFFKLFIDPITRDVLIRMHEPTEVGQLLLRATEMLTTEDALPSASMANHRLRGYERFTTTLYNEMARSYASYSRQRGNRKSYSINPEAVFLRLIQDQTLHIIEEMNPVENVKDKHAATYTGGGGRTAQSFVVEDRQFPADAVGILSEATPYNSKVAINTYVTASPLVTNIRGMFDTDIDPTKLEPSQVLSISSLLMPCATNDD